MSITNKSWVKWSAISEILSSISILATLVYLAMQVGHNTQADQAAARTAIWQINQITTTSMIKVPRIATSMRKPEVLNLEEKTELFSWLVSFYGVREFVWLQYQAGVVDQKTFETYMSGIENQLVLPRNLSWWRIFSDSIYDSDFVEHVNAKLAQHTTDPIRDKMTEWL